MTTSTKRAFARAAAIAAFLLPAAAAPNAAAAQTFPDPGGSGASVTVSTTEVYPGQRVAISGTGFKGSTPAGPGGAPPAGGVPLVAIKPYDIDVDWTWGGPNAYNGPEDAKIWFAPDAVDGNWSGYVDIPTTLTADGILPGANKGKHWWRILSGAFSTGGSGPFTGNVSVPITYQVPFTVVERVQLGLTGPGATPLFQTGTNFRPNAQITAKGQDFTPSTAVAVTLDGAPLTTSITTQADGSFPASARVPLPADTPLGSHTLTFTTGAISVSRTINVVATPTATLLTPAVRPGGRVAFRLTGYLGVGGTGQKVAVVVNEAVLACLTADTSGALTGSAVLPANLAGASAIVGFNAGTSCGGPGSPVNDQPGTRVAPTATLSNTAPSATVAGNATIGQTVNVSGSGFTAGTNLTATVDGKAISGAIPVGADGSFSGVFPLPADLAPGERLLLVSGGGATAAAVFTAVAPEPVADQPKPITEQPKPNVPAPAPPKPVSPAISKAKFKSGKLTLSLGASAAKGTKVTVRSSKKVKLTKKGKAKTIVLAKLTTKKDGKSLVLTLTTDGKRALKALGKVKVVVEIVAPGATPSTKTITLKG